MSVELPLKRKYLTGGKSTNKSTSSNSGINKHKGESDKTRLKEAQAQTKRHQMTLVLKEGKKRAWARTSSITS